MTAASGGAHRLFRSTSAFLQAMLEKRRPTPLMLVRANMTLTLPSRLVFSTRRMCWKLDSFMMSDLRARETEGPAQHERRLAALEGRTAAEASDATEPDLRRQQRLKAGRDGQSWRRFVHQAFALTCWLLGEGSWRCSSWESTTCEAQEPSTLGPPKSKIKNNIKGVLFAALLFTTVH